ncbi:putative bifunctional diguanylate cyclase/phosphodiesterase [Paractinoplanes brasiliensis]|uniref:Diguanylate cyclase (GGDEF)-like protein n=1 Tax=Paractinoplanes brasiliensis TaxID=52695 RepID=A0A4R6K0U2_9ACTN|nr:EAL domain-containing protein [Actinoplanes brasiliensis]TDO42367.1 diguanylate cyclase (GGDEF)-like protein [Actinoplanes brasiliensis]GID29600.1 hypothetical protein Abr02nite_45830 [Actinoplanes brasiliensis]
MAIKQHAPLRYVLAVTAVLVTGALWFLTRIGPDAVAYLFMPIGGAAGVWSVVALLRRARLDPAARRFWRLLLIALALFSAGYAWLAVDAFRISPVLPSVALGTLVPAGLGLLLAMWAVGRVPLGITGQADRRKQLIDRAIAFVGGGALMWSFGLAPLITTQHSFGDQALVLIGLTFLLGLGGIVKVSYINGGPVDRVALRLIAGAASVAAGVSVLAFYGDEGALLAQSVVMPAAFVFSTGAVYMQWKSAGSRPRRANVWLPYLSVLAIDLAMLSVLRGDMSWPDQIVIVAVVVLTALIAVRQLMATRENRMLMRDKRITEDRLRHEVTHDGLTGLANRGLFRERLAEAIASGQATVLLVDLDDFKTVNDSLGHDVGDELLIAVAGVLNAAARPDGLVARLGGDEFAVLLTGDEVTGETVADRLIDALSEPVGPHRLLTHCSVGIAGHAPGVGLDELLRHADIAMYAAKQRGKANRVRYHDGMEQPVLAHARLGGELRQALDDGEFRLYYQPIVELCSGRIVGVEPLIRWEHPTRGLVTPGEFLPAAEATGLIVPMGRFVLREACRQAARWLAEFGPESMQKIGPNVSVRQLHDPDFIDDVRTILAETSLPADRLVLELTESTSLRGTQVSRTLHQLHAMGVRLALDDFGTGESSLSLLRSFPASIIKLDRSFVEGIELDEPGTSAADARQAVAHAVVQLAGALGLVTVAEGIESQEQADLLLRLGYSLGQGYHMARPMPSERMTELFAANQALVAVGGDAR